MVRRLSLRDVTAQKKAEQQIREEVRRRDHFLAVLSHELRNPTAAIMNASAILSKKGASPDARINKPMGLFLVTHSSWPR